MLPKMKEEEEEEGKCEGRGQEGQGRWGGERAKRGTVGEGEVGNRVRRWEEK
jgi:hypothetical protein